MKKIKTPDGRVVNGEEANIVKATEHWNKYKLSDGVIIEAKLVISEIIKIVDEYNELGEPVYVIKSQNIMKEKVPEELLRIPKEGEI